MFKIMRLLAVIFCLSIFSVFLVSAEEYKPDPAVVKLLKERIAQAKKIEKAGLRPAKELADEITHSSLIAASIQVAAKTIKEGNNLAIAEAVINPTSLQEQTVVPIVEKSFAYLALRDISNLKGDEKNAKNYTRKAFENLQGGIKYYSKITESPFALYNLVYFQHLAENVFKLGEKSNLDKEKALRLLKENPLIEERMYEINRAATAWDEVVLKRIPKK